MILHKDYYDADERQTISMLFVSAILLFSRLDPDLLPWYAVLSHPLFRSCLLLNHLDLIAVFEKWLVYVYIYA